MAVGGRVLQQQLAFAPLEADGQRPLHVWRQPPNDVLVVVQTGQVLAMGQLSHLAAHGAAEGLELQRGDIDAG